MTLGARTLEDLGFRNEIHQRAFVIAGLTDEALLKDVQKLLTKAMEKGIPFEQFQREFKKTIEGRWLPTSKTGEPNTGWRARIIYHTNMRMAYAEARRKEMEKKKITHPYWRWRIGPAKVHRQDHVMRDGMILSADDPWWDEHYPPDGYGCNCFVQPIDNWTMENLGKVDADGNPVPDTPPPDAVKKPSVVDGGPIPQRDLEAALERSKFTSPKPTEIPAPSPVEPTQAATNVTSPEPNSAPASQPISEPAEPLPAEPVKITASGETPVSLTLPEVAQSLPIQTTPAPLGSSLGDGGNSGDMGGGTGGNGGSDNNEGPQWEDVPEKHFGVWHQAMAARYKELLPKHFPHGVGKQALAAGLAKEQLDDALLALRKEMPRSRILIDGLPDRIKDALGTSADCAFFSADSLAKQLYYHPEITTAEYRSVIAKIKDSIAEVYRTREKNRIALIVSKGRHYAVILKSTKNHSGSYLLSLHGLNPRTLKDLRKTCERIF